MTQNKNIKKVSKVNSLALWHGKINEKVFLKNSIFKKNSFKK